MKPSTTVRASRSSLPIRASTLGSTNLAPGMALPSTSRAMVTILHPGLWHGYHLEELVDDLVGGDAFRFGAEVREHPVAQDRVRHGANVLEADVIAPVGERAGLAAEHQVLRGADAGAKRHVLLHQVGGLLR